MCGTAPKPCANAPEVVFTRCGNGVTAVATLTRPFMASSIIGATSTEQLSTVLGATEITLGDDVLAEGEAAHRAHPMPY